MYTDDVREGDMAFWIIESVFLHLPDKEFWTCL